MKELKYELNNETLRLLDGPETLSLRDLDKVPSTWYELYIGDFCKAITDNLFLHSHNCVYVKLPDSFERIEIVDDSENCFTDDELDLSFTVNYKELVLKNHSIKTLIDITLREESDFDSVQTISWTRLMDRFIFCDKILTKRLMVDSYFNHYSATHYIVRSSKILDDDVFKVEGPSPLRDTYKDAIDDNYMARALGCYKDFISGLNYYSDYYPDETKTIAVYAKVDLICESFTNNFPNLKVLKVLPGTKVESKSLKVIEFDPTKEKCFKSKLDGNCYLEGDTLYLQSSKKDVISSTMNEWLEIGCHTSRGQVLYGQFVQRKVRHLVIQEGVKTLFEDELSDLMLLKSVSFPQSLRSFDVSNFEYWFSMGILDIPPYLVLTNVKNRKRFECPIQVRCLRMIIEESELFTLIANNKKNRTLGELLIEKYPEQVLFNNDGKELNGTSLDVEETSLF